jgi:transglutaminase-like putative cysteine protease
MAVFLSVLRRLAFSLIFPLLLYFFTRAAGPIEMILIYAGVGVLCGEMITRRKDFWKGIFQVVAAVWVLVGILAIFAILNITPPPAYRIWFRLVREGNAVGLISFYFVMKSVILFSVLSLVTYFAKTLPPLGVGVFIHLLVMGLVLENFIIIGASVLLLLGVLAVVDLHGENTKRKGLGVAILSGIILLTVSVSAPGILLPPISPGGVGGEAILTLRHFLGRFLPQEYYKLGDGSYYFTFTGSTLESPAAMSNTPLFDFKGDPGEVHYLRTQTFDQFLDSRWTSTLISMRGPGMRLTRGPLETDYKIRVIGDILSYVPYTEGTRTIGLPREMVAEANQKQFQGTVSFDEIPLTEGMEVYLQEGEPGEPGVAMEYVGNFANKYLQVPRTLPPSLYEKVEEIKASYTTDQERIEAIRTYLAEDFRYTLSPPVFTGEPLHQFVEVNKAGYCVHFATTFVMMARLMKIKTRYVSGFRVFIPGMRALNPVIKVHGLFAHAWPEVYLEENGVWQKIEATPPMMPENLNNTEYWRQFAGEVDEQTLEQLSSIVGDETDAEEIKPEISSVDWEDAVSWTILTLSISFGLLALVGILILITAYFRVPYRKRVLRRFSETCFRLGGPRPEKQGWTNLARWLVKQGYWTVDNKDRFTKSMLPKIYELEDWVAGELPWFDKEAKRITKANRNRIAALKFEVGAA